MAIITAIYSFSLRLSLTPPPPRLVLVRDRSLFSFSVSHTHILFLSLSLLLFFAARYLSLTPPHSPVPLPRAGWCTGLARVRPSGCQRVVEPPPRRLLSRCWPVSSKPRDLSSFECNAVVCVVRHGSTQTELRTSRSPSLSLPLWSLLTSIIPLLSTSIERTLAREFQRRVPIPERHAIPMRLQSPPPPPPPRPRRGDSIAAGRVRMHGPTRT